MMLASETDENEIQPPLTKRWKVAKPSRTFSIFCFVQLIALLAIFKSTSESGISVVFLGADDNLFGIHSDPALVSRMTTAEAVAAAYTPNQQLSLKVSNQTTSSLTKQEESVPKEINATTIRSGNTTSIISSSTTKRRLPTLDELTAIPADYRCPLGTTAFPNTELPHNVTHAGRKIPKVIHLTAKTRCVTKDIRKHIRKWRFLGHSLYFHDDDAAYRLLEYASNDANGHELVRNLSKAILCISNGATLSDLWRYVLLYYYGGVYTDLDNSPGPKYSPDLIQSDADAFFFVESLGTMSQFYLALSKHHPLMLHILKEATRALYEDTNNNVMKNVPAHTTGPGAVKRGMIEFQKAANVTSNGYLPAGIYEGDMGTELVAHLPWWREQLLTTEDSPKGDYHPQTNLFNRTVTIVGTKKEANLYIVRSGMKKRKKEQAWKAMNMTHYKGAHKVFPKTNRISCKQHVARMEQLVAVNTSYYYGKTHIVDLLPNYRYSKSKKRYIDEHTNEKLVPDKTEKKPSKEPTNESIDSSSSNNTQEAPKNFTAAMATVVQ